MTRFLRPLANKVLVVSEVSGGAAEQATWGRAIVFANSSSSSSDGRGGRRGGASELARVLRWYLSHPHARRERAVRAQALLRSLSAEDALRGPVSDLVQRSCPAWRPASTDP